MGRPRQRSPQDIEPVVDVSAATALLTGGERQSGSEYVGTRAQLIGAGLAVAGDFPGDPECACKVSHQFTRATRFYRIRVRSFVTEPREFVLWRSGQRRSWSTDPPASTLSASDSSKQEVAAPRDDDGDNEDDDWPPKVSHSRAIELGDGSRWHYLGSPDAMLLEGLLDADEIPGNPASSNAWYTWGLTERKHWIATRLGARIALTLFDTPRSFLGCQVSKFKPT